MYVVQKCVRQLQNKHGSLRSEATRLLQILTLSKEGVDAAISTGLSDVGEEAKLTTGIRAKVISGARPGAIKALVDLLKDPLCIVRRAATGTLMSLVVNIEGKKQFLKIEGVQPLVYSLNHEIDLWTKQNAIQIVATLACLPAARMTLRKWKVEEALENLADNSNNATIDELSKVSLEALRWDP